MPSSYTPARAVVDFACGALFALFIFAFTWSAWLIEYGACDSCSSTLICE